jgi:sarcosine oxidase
MARQPSDVGDVDVVVIGAGAMGSATAWWLARRGVDVALVEQFEPGHARGSSHGGSRIFRLAYAEPHYVDLALEALDLWREVEDDAGESLLDVTGGVDHGAAEHVGPVAGALEDAGRAVERLTPDAAAARWPGLRFGDDELVVHSPDTGRLSADRCVAALQRRAAELGADVRFGCAVSAVDAAARTVRLAGGGGELRARRAVVVTAGAWVTKALAGTGFPLPPITVTREQVFHFAPVDGALDAWPVFIHYQPTLGVYGVATPGEGVKVAEHGTGPLVDADTRTFDVDADGRDRVVTYVERWLPGLVPRPVSEATCLYTNTPDASFVLDRRGDLVVGSACSGHGFKFTPAIGRRLAELAYAGS